MGVGAVVLQANSLPVTSASYVGTDSSPNCSTLLVA